MKQIDRGTGLSPRPVRHPREFVLGPDDVLLDGNVHTYVHVNDPGGTEWEGFVTAAYAAASGSVASPRWSRIELAL